MIPYEDFKKAEIRIGKIISAEKIPNTDKLLLIKVDFAEEPPRQIVSGIAPYFPDPTSLVGVKCAFATNLEPRIIRGYESQGMILAVGGGDSPFSILKVDESAKEGSGVK
ncbi:MAG: methionyl-tRNA synthetase, methionyl-tRNA synthetase [Parcubacteria group bacterium]|nr:methionyl-tRNA synthetase, methionyl-tRNA synthetase [Parcubacteria group bacterium]